MFCLIVFPYLNLSLHIWKRTINKAKKTKCSHKHPRGWRILSSLNEDYNHSWSRQTSTFCQWFICWTYVISGAALPKQTCFWYLSCNQNTQKHSICHKTLKNPINHTFWDFNIIKAINLRKIFNLLLQIKSLSQPKCN